MILMMETAKRLPMQKNLKFKGMGMNHLIVFAVSGWLIVSGPRVFGQNNAPDDFGLDDAATNAANAATPEAAPVVADDAAPAGADIFDDGASHADGTLSGADADQAYVDEVEGNGDQGGGDPAGKGRPVKLDFRNAPLSTVMRVISDESKMNFMIPPDVGSIPVNLSLHNVPWDEALRAILDSNGLSLVELNANVVRIDRLEKLNQEKLALEQVKASAKRLSPTQVLVVRLSYAKADKARETINNILTASSAGDPRVRVEADLRTNSLLIEAIATDIAKVKAVIERLDLPTPQVQIASRIVEKIRDDKDFLGISWGGPLNFDQSRGLGFGNLTFPSYLTSSYAVDVQGQATAGTYQMSVGSINGSFGLDLLLQMEETKGTTEILQSNNVTVQDNEEALISAGQVDYVLARQPDGSQQLTAIDYVLKMTVTPHITADGSVQMALNIISDDPRKATSGVAAKNNRELKTSLLRRTGETAVIGGLYSTNQTEVVRGIPILSRLPIVGALFRSTDNQQNRRELLIMVTPTIVGGSSGGGASTTSMASDGSYSTMAPEQDFGADQPATGAGRVAANDATNGSAPTASNSFGGDLSPASNSQSASNSANSQKNSGNNASGGQEAESSNEVDSDSENGQNSGNNSF